MSHRVLTPKIANFNGQSSIAKFQYPYGTARRGDADVVFMPNPPRKNS
jgi:hypothetical protein